MFIELIMAVTLDLSLPEFQPEKDISGNYIELSTDVSTGDVVLDELTQEEFDSSVSEHLPVLDSQPADPTREVVYEYRALSTSDNDIVSAIQNFNNDNNEYWELFLDSYDVEKHYSLSSITLNNPEWKFGANFSVIDIGSSNVKIVYIPVVSGVHYYITNLTRPTYNEYYFAVVDNIQWPTVVSNTYHDSINTPSSSYDFVSSQDGYFVAFIYYSQPISFDSNWTIIERESYTLSELGNAVLKINEKQRIILFICLMNFCLPFLINGLRLVMGGKDSNV